MTTFKSFEEMEVWKESRNFLFTIRKICKRDSVKRDFPFVDQITRSARSISANIAEGFESMTTPEFIQYLGYAKRSTGETRSHIYDGLDEKYLSQIEFEKLKNQAQKIGSMLAKLIHHLQSVDPKLRRTFHREKRATNNE